MKSHILEEVCNLANLYYSNPRSVVGIYNRCIDKSYIRDEDEAIRLTARVMRRYVPKRNSADRYNIFDYYEIKKKGL